MEDLACITYELRNKSFWNIKDLDFELERLRKELSELKSNDLSRNQIESEIETIENDSRLTISFYITEPGNYRKRAIALREKGLIPINCVEEIQRRTINAFNPVKRDLGLISTSDMVLFRPSTMGVVGLLLDSNPLIDIQERGGVKWGYLHFDSHEDMFSKGTSYHRFSPGDYSDLNKRKTLDIFRAEKDNWDLLTLLLRLSGSGVPKEEEFKNLDIEDEKNNYRNILFYGVNVEPWTFQGNDIRENLSRNDLGGLFGRPVSFFGKKVCLGTERIGADSTSGRLIGITSETKEILRRLRREESYAGNFLPYMYPGP